jgi:hypothetical protein
VNARGRWLLLPAVVLGLTAAPASATEPGYNMWFAGQVLSVDSQHGLLRIARGPTETAGPAVETCTMRTGPLQRVHAGMQVEAQADTSRRPWRILHMRIFRIRPLFHKRTPVVALRSGSSSALQG